MSRETPLEVREDPLRKEEIVFRRRSNARRYIAKVDDAGEIVVTVPRGGTKREAWEFVREHESWLKQQRKETREKIRNRAIVPGASIWFRGERVILEVVKDWGRPVLLCGDERIFLADESMNLARPLADHLRRLARNELVGMTRALARRFDLEVGRISIRDQRTRWGSCSESRSISLNWRLILAPLETAEYIVIHELLHLKEMNHSPAFWGLVEEACPRFREHEKWLHDHYAELSW
jgi:predicted metal-dependent hydrolase